MCASDCGEALSLAALTTFCGNIRRAAIIGGYVDDTKQAKELESCVLHNKKLHILYFESAATTNSPDNEAVVTTDSATTDSAVINGLSILAGVAAAADPWSVNADSVVGTASVHRTAKSRYAKPAVHNIIRAGSIKAQAAVLHAVADHSSLATACELARISSSKDQAAQRFVCKQSARLMKRSRAQKLRANVSSDKCLAAEVMLPFSAPSPDLVCGKPSQRCRARVLGVPRRTLSRVDRILIEKHRQLTVGKKNAYSINNQQGDPVVVGRGL